MAPANNLQPAEPSREIDSDESSPRGNRVIISLTDDEFEELKALIPAMERRLDRKVVPLGTAAYQVFRRGLELERAS